MDKIKTPVWDGGDTSILDANGRQIAFAVFSEMSEIVQALNTAGGQSRVIEVMRTALEKALTVTDELAEFLDRQDVPLPEQLARKITGVRLDTRKALAEAQRIMEGK